MRTIHGTTWSVEDAQAYIKARVKVDENGCWIWQRAINHGYGYHWVSELRRMRRAHRTAYEAFVGPVPRVRKNADAVVMHACDVRACCNPAHLRIGTQADNVKDRDAKSRQARGPRHGQVRLTDAQVREIRTRYANERTSQRKLAAEFGVSHPTVWAILRGETWTHLEESEV